MKITEPSETCRYQDIQFRHRYSFLRACTSIFLVSVSKRILDSSNPAIVIYKLGHTHNGRVESRVDANAF
jgi:hypothetical protein